MKLPISNLVDRIKIFSTQLKIPYWNHVLLYQKNPNSNKALEVSLSTSNAMTHIKLALRESITIVIGDGISVIAWKLPKMIENGLEVVGFKVFVHFRLVCLDAFQERGKWVSSHCLPLGGIQYLCNQKPFWTTHLPLVNKHSKYRVFNKFSDTFDMTIVDKWSIWL